MNKFLVLILFGLVMASCNTDVDTGDFVAGADYLAINNRVVLVDTATVSIATINFDSLITSSRSRILVGNYDDPVFGKVKSDSYFQLSANNYKLYNSNSDTDVPNYVFDSIALILRYDSYSYGDTTNTQSFQVHRLTQKVKPNLDDDSFYNSSSLEYSPQSLGAISFKPRPTDKDSVNITLSPVFGNELFQKIKNNELENYNEFVEYFKGLVVKSNSSTSSNLVGFATTSVLRMYYSKALDPEEVSLIKDFSIQDISRQFNNITLNRTGTLIENLPVPTSSLPSSQTNNVAFIQSGTGIACRIDFPHIKQLQYLSDKGAIVDAQLIIKPIKNSYSDLHPIPDSLLVYVSDHLNRISGTLNNSNSGQMYAQLQNANDEFGENGGYKINIGPFLQKEMLKKAAPASSLILTLPNFSNGVDRLLLGNQKNADNKIQLKIYYISY